MLIACGQGSLLVLRARLSGRPPTALDERPEVTGAREIAFDVLLTVERTGAFADALLGRALEHAPELAPADRALATRLVYGTLARRLTIDHTLSAYSRRALAELDPVVLTATRLGIYQLHWLDRVPPHAAVDTAVSLASRGGAGAAGYANAVLRRVARTGLAPPPQHQTQRLAVEQSHPDWLVERWLDEFGHDDAVRLMQANNEALPSIVRALVPTAAAIAALAEQGIHAKPARWAPDGLVTAVPRSIPGLIVPQAEGSQLVSLFVAAQPGERVLDACAAPGGKAAYLASMVGARGRLVAVDPGRDAPRRIGRALAACGLKNVEIRHHPIEALDDEAGFDRVLVDAPCSGLGTLSEHPEIRWRRRPEDIVAASARQQRILAAAAAHVRRGGLLVYATCTLARAENDGVVDRFLAEHSDFCQDSTEPLPAALAPLVANDGRLRIEPHRHGTGGFFAARLRRR
jgi:16S rRNA (cytosine967-C5)-methyltransferase